MKVISLNAFGWRTTDDFFAALLPKLGAPGWHGYNLNALEDSLYGGINEVEPPFTVEVSCTTYLRGDMTTFLDEVADIFATAKRDYGSDVTFRLI